MSGWAWQRGHGQRIGRVDDPEAAEEVFAPCAAAALYQRDAFQEVGGFDESYFCYFEDIDLGFRLRLAGHRCLYVPQAVALHLGAATAGRESDFAVYHAHRNLVWTYVKNMPARAARALPPAPPLRKRAHARLVLAARPPPSDLPRQARRATRASAGCGCPS